MGVLALVLALSLAAQSPETRAGDRPPPTRPGISWEEADSVVRTLRRVARRVRSGRPASKGPLVVTEGEINSFVNLTLADQIPPELSGLTFRLGKDRLGARGVLDLDLLRTKLPEEGLAAMLAMLSGAVPVELDGEVVSGDGLIRVELERVLIGGVSVPPALLAQFVGIATRTEEQPEGLDITAPFELPWTARSVRLKPGRALFDFYPPVSTP